MSRLFRLLMQVSVLRPSNDVDPNAWIDVALQQGGVNGLLRNRDGAAARVSNELSKETVS